ncbi:MAG: hypothetical protein MI748_16835 [Opitutales bacterium]|nr:hypothetical protein [Opitutales bacterium]
MKIGFDFDNTIISYDKAFYMAALEMGWIDPSVAATKTAVRNDLRERGLEESWIELQGFVYGARLDLAEPFPGVIDCLSGCLNRDWEVVIVSHKTKHPFKGPAYDLHAASRRWIEHIGIIDSQSVFLELTKEEKCLRIHGEQCDFFIDDLPEFLSHPQFPETTRRVLFDHQKAHVEHRGGDWLIISDWVEAINLLEEASS